MLYTIQNEQILFTSSDQNAEPWVLRFLDEDANYIWRPPEVEKLGAAICFPLLGVLPDGQYTLDGQIYSMGTHGFAKDRKFKVVKRTDCQIVYELSDDEDSRRQYPYAFRLQIVYRLEAAMLKTEYRVKNNAKDVMYFSIGGHPRYACPVETKSSNVSFEEHYLEFSEAVKIEDVVKAYSPIEAIQRGLQDDGRRLRLDYSMFADGCFCFHPFQAKEVCLKNTKNKRAIRMYPRGVSHFQLWTQPNGRFLCLEPWYGSITLSPPRATDNDWKRREGTMQLQPGEEWTGGYTVEILR